MADRQLTIRRVLERWNLARDGGVGQLAEAIDEALGEQVGTWLSAALSSRQPAQPPPPSAELVERPLSIRNGVADMMVDELAKQIQKVAVYSSKARRWRDRAIELGSAPGYVFEADAADVKHDEVCLKEARSVLANAWEQQGHTERDDDQAPDAQGGEGSRIPGQRDEAAVSAHVKEEPNPDGGERLREAEELLARIAGDDHSHLLFAIDDIEAWKKKYDARKGTT